MAADDLISIDPDVLGETPVFKGTRVPVRTLFEYLDDNYTLDQFAECFPSVSLHGPPRPGPVPVRPAGPGRSVKILLDECVPWPLRHQLPGHDCQSVPQCGWAGITDGQLLALAEPRFEMFITTDQNLTYQQNLVGRMIAIVQLSTNNLRRPLTAAEAIRAQVAAIQPGQFRAVDFP